MINRAVAVASLVFALGACDLLPDYLGEAEAPPLPGERISVLALERAPEPDQRIADLEVRLPRPTVNLSWPQSGGYADHAMHHIAVPGPLEKVWIADAGEGDSEGRGLMAPPIVADGRVYTFDAESTIIAHDTSTGKRIWEAGALPEDEEDDAFGGGIAYGSGRIFAATGVGEVIAFDASNGSEIWRVAVGVPIRSSPTLSEGRLFVVSYDNQLFALSAVDGRMLWTHSGIAENAQLLGTASPAVASGLVITAFSSGELFALRADNGRVAWSDTLSFGTRLGASTVLSDINGSPVIDRDRVYAVSFSGRLVAISLRTGDRLWDQEVSGVQTPWIAGDFLFLLTTDGDLLCLSRRDGRIRWVHSLPRYEDPEDREDPIYWTGPILVSDRLIVVGSNGQAVSISPYSGRLLGRIELPDGVDLPPVVANGTVYVLTNEGDLVALR